MRRRRRRNNKKPFFVGLFLILAGFAILFIVTDSIARPIIINNIKTAATHSFINITNAAMQKVLKENAIDYKSLANIEKDGEDNITAVQCDTVMLTKVKTLLDEEIDNQLENTPYIKFSIPIGTFTGNEYLVGRGPKITFKFKLACAVKAEFDSEFSAAGINQTIHKINLNLITDINAMIPWYQTNTTVETSYVLAETLIVGKVPATFADISLDSLNELLSAGKK